MAAIENLEKKTNYRTEPKGLLREQYKNLPVINGILETFGEQAQQVEDALFQIKDLNEGFGIRSGISRDALEKTAVQFGVPYPELLSDEDIVFEARAAAVVMFSRGRLEDIRRLPEYLYGLKSDIIETGDGIYLAIFGALTQKNTSLIFRSAQKLMPAGNQIYGIIQNNSGWFGFEGFQNTGTWRLSTDLDNQAHRMPRLAVNGAGEWLL